MTCNTFKGYLSQKDCVFWDWNGTLLNDLDFSINITNGFLSSKGVGPLSKLDYQTAFTIPISDYYQNLKLKEKGLCLEETSNAYLKNYANGRHELEMFEGAVECLQHLYQSNVKQILFSAAHISELEYQTSKHGIKNLFHLLSGAEDFKAGCKLERGLKIKKEQNLKSGVVVGDTLHDVEIGKEMGFETVWVSEGHQPIEKAVKNSAVDYIYDRSENSFYKNF